MGYTANEICCGCDGGCLDSHDSWYDSGGPIYTCEWYAKSSSRCDLFGDSYADKNGFTANDICCVCGGGFFKLTKS